MHSYDPIQHLLGGKREETVYMHCLQNGPISISDLAKNTDIKRPTLYALVRHLSRQGYLSTTHVGKRILYDAVAPTVFEEHMARQTEELKERMPSLTSARQKTQILPDISIVGNDNGLRKMYTSIYKRVSEGEEICFLTSVDDAERYAPWVLQGYLTSVRSALYPQVRELLRWDNAGKTYARNIRAAGFTHPCGLLKKGIHIRNDLILWKNNVVLVSFQKRPWALHINNPLIFSTMQALFDLAWATRKER